MGRNEELDASGQVPLFADEAIAFEGANHLHGLRGGDPKNGAVCRLQNLTEQALVDTDEDQVVDLLFGHALRAAVACDVILNGPVPRIQGKSGD